MPTRSAAAKAKAPQPKKAEPVHAIPADEASDSDDESTDDLSGEPDTSIDPYEVLDVPRDATEDQIKKAYRKLALRWHPDKAQGADTASAHTTFQRLTFAYSILSSPSRRTRYDATGLTSDSALDADSDDFNWSDFFRERYAEVTVGAVQTFLSGYKGGDEEREAVLESYRKGKGDMDVVYECVMGSGVLEDDDRFRKIIDEGIEKGEVEAYKKYTEESEQSKARRRKTAEAEAKEAEVEAEKMKRKGKKAEGGKKSAGGGGESELMAMIQKRQQERGGTFLEGMEAKYKRIEEEEKAKKAGKKGGKKRKQEEVDADEPLEEAFAKMGERMQKGKKNKR